MADATGWTAEQWDRVNAAVRDTFQKASVTSQFLPHYGPMPDSATFVRTELLKKETQGNPPKQTVSVTDDDTTKLFTLRVYVELSSEQVADDELTSALLAFRRAANMLAQTEDHYFFIGTAVEDVDADAARIEQEMNDPKNAHQRNRLERAAEETREEARELERRAEPFGLLTSKRPDRLVALAKLNPENRRRARTLRTNPQQHFGQKLVTSVVNAISTLEDSYHSGPFACVLGNRLFEEAYRPNSGSMVLPADRIKPLLNGPLLRSGQLDEDTGIVASVSGNDIDVVVGTPPSVQFLQVSMDAKYCFRVYAKTVLRIKDTAKPAVVTLHFE